MQQNAGGDRRGRHRTPRATLHAPSHPCCNTPALEGGKPSVLCQSYSGAFSPPSSLVTPEFHLMANNEISGAPRFTVGAPILTPSADRTPRAPRCSPAPRLLWMLSEDPSLKLKHAISPANPGAVNISSESNVLQIQLLTSRGQGHFPKTTQNRIRAAGQLSSWHLQKQPRCLTFPAVSAHVTTYMLCIQRPCL